MFRQALRHHVFVDCHLLCQESHDFVIPIRDKLVHDLGKNHVFILHSSRKFCSSGVSPTAEEILFYTKRTKRESNEN